MNTDSNATRQNTTPKVQVHFVGGGTLVCASPADADLVLDAEQRLYEGNTGRKLPRETLAALERAGQNGANSLLYRSVMHNVADE